MIHLNFGLWWSGSPLSYLRYLTFKTLRHFHPYSRIQLYVSNKFKITNMDMVTTELPQEFVKPDKIKKDYLPMLNDLNVEIISFDKLAKYSPNHQSDIFRWNYLYENGGFYLDTDQIIVRSFKSLPLKCNNFIYSSYDIKSDFAINDHFSPVGVLGSSKKGGVAKEISKNILKYYDDTNYNCIGPWMFESMSKKIDMSMSFNAPQSYFYPVPICDYMKNIYDGSLKINRDTYAIHWFGGCGSSQSFNRKYTEEFAKTSKDSISTFLRDKKII